MTRFLITLQSAVDLIFRAINHNVTGVYIPILNSCKIMDLAEVMIEHYNTDSKIEFGSIRRGEKLHEIMMTEEESRSFQEVDDQTILINENFTSINVVNSHLVGLDYSSKNWIQSKSKLKDFLSSSGVLE
jgi:FlaA1/EpsC-like NDP-sugar epimerase